MVAQTAASVTCPNCGNAFSAPIHQIIDVEEDPVAKSRLLSGQMNIALCPHCGFQGALNAPFLYHDADLEIAYVYMPMEAGRSNEEQQKIIGDLTNRLMNRLPPEARKGYLLQPRTFLSLQSLIDAILEEDEETREMVQAQQRKMELMDQLREIDPEDGLAVAQFVSAHDADLDGTFFQILDVMIGAAEAQGDVGMQSRLERHRENLLEKSSTGQMFQAQQEAIEALAAEPTRETLIEQLVATESREVREALVTVGRQLLDYAFFQTLTQRIEAAEREDDAATREKLAALRKEVQEIRDEVDAVAMAVIESRTALLQELLLAEDPKELAMRHLPELDSAFIDVLSTNLQRAESEGHLEMVQRLRRIGDVVIELINEMAPPEIRLVNRLATAGDEAQVRQILEEERHLLDEDFVQLIERAAQDLEQSGREQGAERLRYAREQLEGLIA